MYQDALLVVQKESAFTLYKGSSCFSPTASQQTEPLIVPWLLTITAATANYHKIAYIER
jgi:hypothetical protein